MRILLLLAITGIGSGCLYAQAPDTGGQTLQALMAEVHQLRLAIERSTLLGARTQISLQRVQIQEARVARISQELERVRKEIPDIQGHSAQLAAHAKEREERLTQTSDPGMRREIEVALKHQKLELEQANAIEQQRRAREAELAAQVITEQGRLTEIQDRIADMERSLDAAIRQIIGGK